MRKKQIEEKLGISYEEFITMDYDEQRKLIEDRIGDKIQPDYRQYIDGIPIDENHIMSREKTDRRIDEITASGSKKLIKKLLNPFHKK